MHSELEHADLLFINDTTAILSPHTLDGLQAERRHLHAVGLRRGRPRVWKHIPAHVQKIIRDRKLRASATPTW